MPIPSSNEVILFTNEEIPAAEAEFISAIEKAIKQPTPNLLAISMAILNIETSWRSNLRQTRETESFNTSQSLNSLQEKEQDARKRFPDQVVAAKPEQLVGLQQQLREEIASIAGLRADLEAQRNQAQNDLQILFADLEKGEKLTSQFQKPSIVNANIPLSRPTINVLSRLFTISPVKEEATLALSPGQDLLTTARDTIAASKTRALTSITDDAITIEVKKRSVGRPKLSNTPTVVHFKVSDILKDEGINLSELDSTNAQGITMSLKALLRDDVGIEDPTLDDMEKALRGIVRGDYRELLDNRRTLLTLDGLAKPMSAPAKIEEIKLKETQAEEVVITTTPTVQPQRAFATPEPAGKRTMLDLAIVTDALTFDSHGRWKTGDLVSFSELTTDQRLSKEQGRAGNKRRDRQEVFAEVQTDFSKTADRVVRIADKVGAQTIGQLLNNKALEIPETQRQKLLPFAAVPVDQLPKVLDAIKMHGGISNRFKPVDQRTLLDFLLPKDSKAK